MPCEMLSSEHNTMRTNKIFPNQSFVPQFDLSIRGPCRSVMFHTTRTAAFTPARNVSLNAASVRFIGTRSASQDDVDLLRTNRDPEDVRGAIAVGLSLYEGAKYKEALEVFERALKLPGTGPKRYRDKPRTISDGEKQSVLYNIACCYSRLADVRTGLVALAGKLEIAARSASYYEQYLHGRGFLVATGCLEAGYDDVKQLRMDPDLEFLRNDQRFEGLIERFKLTTRKGFFNDFLKGFNF